MYKLTIAGFISLILLLLFAGSLYADPQNVNDFAYLDENWPTLQHDQNRAGMAGVGVGADVNCNLTLNHSYTSYSSSALSLGPIIYEGKVVAPFNDGTYAVFDLADISTPLYILGGLGENNRSVPSIFEINGNPYLYLSGSDGNSIYCYDFSTVPATYVWEISSANDYRGHPEFNNTSYSNFALLNDGSEDVLFIVTDGIVIAAEALTGDPYSGWDAVGNYVHFGGMSGTMYRGLVGDRYNNKLYISYFGAPRGGVASIDAFTGEVDWELTGSDLKGSEVYGMTLSIEFFIAGIAYDMYEGAIYAVSTCVGDYPVDGVFYKINAYDGTVVYAEATNYMNYAQTPVIGENFVYCPSYTRWAHPPIDHGAILAYHKYNGVLSWVKGWGDATTDNRFYSDILLTDEATPAPNLLFAFSDRGYLHCLDAASGDELFNRRIDYGAEYGLNIGGGGAVATDPDNGTVHVVFQSAQGGLFDLTGQDDRPRLDIPDYNLTQKVSFGDDPNYPVVFENLFSNTGCTDLEVTIDIYDSPSGSTPGISAVGAVNETLVEQAKALAAKMNDAYLAKIGLTVAAPPFDEKTVINASRKKTLINPAALAAPAFVAVDHYVMPPMGAGIKADFTLVVDQTQLIRGMQTCYAVLSSNDPDFFLNDPAAYGLPDKPEIRLNIFSGCLTDNVTLYFGESMVNYKYVSNSGRLGDGSWEPHLFEIDGEGSIVYQGSYIYGTSKYQLAMNSQDWKTHTDPLDDQDAVFRSMQAEPNFVSDDCAPALEYGINLGKISYDDGASYVNLYGNAAYTTILDSVQNWNDGEGWDWSNVTQFFGPFDDTLTMGLTADVTTIGVYGGEALNGNLHNCVVKVFEFAERNGRAVNDWYMGSYQDMDYEASSGQEVGYDETISAAWTYSAGNDIATGAVKIPFGCDNEPLINAVHFYGNTTEQTGFWGYAYWDSAYSYMANYEGAVDFPAGETGGDGESHYTFVQHDFEPYGEYTFALAYFQLTDINPGAEATPEMIKLARRANQFMGWGRGDVNDDGDIDLLDIVYLINYVYAGGPGPKPFLYLGNVKPVTDGAGITLDDIMFLIDLYFENGPCPEGLWKHIDPAWDAGDL